MSGARSSVDDDEAFGYRERKDGEVVISWYGRPVVTLRGSRAEKFRSGIAKREGREARLLMARATGNFKRGNER